MRLSMPKCNDFSAERAENGEGAEERGGDPRLWRGRRKATAPPSLRKITQGRQDNDARRIVR
jgi:hypothetical protein